MEDLRIGTILPLQYNGRRFQAIVCTIDLQRLTPMKNICLKLCLSALLFGLAAHLQAKSSKSGPPDGRSPTANEQRFNVAHAHTASWCVGYLYISEKGIRYEVVQPEKDKKHSVDLTRAEVKTVQQWILMGTPENVAEVKTARGNYHFWLLPKDADLQKSPLSQWGMNNARPAGPLIAALQGRPASEIENANAPASSSPSSEAPPPAAGTYESSGPTSQSEKKVYFGYYWGGSFNPHIEKAYLVFYPSGWVSKEFPGDGLEGFDFPAYMRNPSNRNFVGKYRINGNTAEIVWLDTNQSHTTVQFDDAASNPHFMGGPYIPLCQCNGVRFSGIYDTGHRDRIQFSPDGTFVDAGAINSVVGVDLSNPWRGGPGTYAVQNYTLFLSYQDGRRVKKSFTAPAAQEKEQVFDWLAIGGITFDEVNHKKPQ